MALLLSKMAPEAISEHLISKNVLGEHPPRPLVLCACFLIYLHTYTSDIDVTPFQKFLATGLG